MSRMVTGTYQYNFPVDEYGRPGGLYSMADLPVKRHEVLTRTCEFLAHDPTQDLYQVKDLEKGWEFVVKADAVEFDHERK